MWKVLRNWWGGKFMVEAVPLLAQSKAQRSLEEPSGAQDSPGEPRAAQRSPEMLRGAPRAQRSPEEPIGAYQRSLG